MQISGQKLESRPTYTIRQRGVTQQDYLTGWVLHVHLPLPLTRTYLHMQTSQVMQQESRHCKTYCVTTAPLSESSDFCRQVCATARQVSAKL